MPLTAIGGADPSANLEPDLQAGASAIAMAATARLVDLAPALRPARDEAEPVHEVVSLTLQPDDPLDALTMASCMAAHNAYVASRGRPGGVSPGALALARLLVWATRAEMLGGRPDVRWIGPPARRPDDIEGLVVTASAELGGDAGPARAQACMVVLQAG